MSLKINFLRIENVVYSTNKFVIYTMFNFNIQHFSTIANTIYKIFFYKIDFFYAAPVLDSHFNFTLFLFNQKLFGPMRNLVFIKEIRPKIFFKINKGRGIEEMQQINSRTIFIWAYEFMKKDGMVFLFLARNSVFNITGKFKLLRRAIPIAFLLLKLILFQYNFGFTK